MSIAKGRLALGLHPAFEAHDPGPRHPERRERYRAVAAMLEGRWLGRALRLEAPPASREALLAVHDAALVDAILASAGRPVTFDADTHTSARSVEAALAASGLACAAVDAVLTDAARAAFVAARPPGHHATATTAMGFCLFNHVAVAAAHARRAHGLERVLVVDWDVHHGNGTQDIFLHDPSVLFFSTHQWPQYPGSGASSEIGAGAGAGFTANVPLAAGSGDAELCAAFRDVLWPLAQAFRPQLVLVSAGYDAHAADPLGGLEVTTAGFGALARCVAGVAELGAEGRVVLLLEGGYDTVALAASVDATLDVLDARRPLAELPAPVAEAEPLPGAAQTIRRTRAALGAHWTLA